MARLAESFNHAAERIEDLMKAHRMLLANASHELRTPLSRIRLGVDLMQQNPDPKYKAAIEQDIAELDQMIDEILLASRLGADYSAADGEERGSAGARGGRRRALRGLRGGGRGGHRVRRTAAAGAA